MTLPAPPLSRELLERVRRDVLARLLSPYRLYFDAKRLSLESLARTAQDDLSLVSSLFDLLSTSDPPAPLLSALSAIEAIACDAGHERLRVLDVSRVLPQGRLGHETLAALAYLDAPELFARAKGAAKPPSVSAFTEYAGASRAPLSRDPSRFSSLALALGEVVAARGRPPFCDALVTHGPVRTTIQFVFGKLPSTEERLTEALVRTQSTDVLTHNVRAVFVHATSHLAVQGHAFLREAIRRLAGEHLFDDPAHFRAVSIYTLAPLVLDLDGALSADDAPGVTSIELREVWLLRADGSQTMHRHDKDLRATLAAADLRAACAEGATITCAKLLVKLDDRARAVRVEIEPPAKLDMNRGDEAVERAVLAMLAHKGILLPRAFEENDVAAERLQGAS